MATLISGRVNFRARNYQGHRGIFHQENIRILSGYAPDNSFTTPEAKTDEIEKKNRQIHNYNSGFQGPFLSN